VTQNELIPRTVLFGNPDRISVKISPDGEKLGYLAPWNGVLNVWVAPVATPKEARVVTRDTGRGVRLYAWAYTSGHILYLQDAGGDENWRAYCVDLATGNCRDLTPAAGVQAQLQQLSPRYPDEALIALNDRDPRLHDLYRVNIASGERELVLQNEGFVGFLTDEAFGVRFALKVTPVGSMEVLARSGDGWAPFDEIPAEDAMTTAPVTLSASGDTLYLTDSRGRDTAALVAWDLSSGKREILAQDDRVDADGFWIHPRTKAVQAVGFRHTKQRWHVVARFCGGGAVPR